MARTDACFPDEYGRRTGKDDDIFEQEVGRQIDGCHTVCENRLPTWPGREGGVGGGGSSSHAWYGHIPSHSYNAGTEHVGFSATRQALLARSTKRREELGESREG